VPPGYNLSKLISATLTVSPGN